MILFGPEHDSTLSYRIPVLHVMRDGTQYAFCEARQGSGGDWDPMHLMMRRKVPGGNWEPMRSLCYNDRGPAHNPGPFEVDGALHLLYGLDYKRFYHIFSTDGGDTFSEPTDITHVFEAFYGRADWHCIAVGPGGVARLDSGRIVAPVWLGGLDDPGKHAPAQAASIYSDDDGKTWQAGEIIDFFPHGPSEAQIAPVPGGALISLRNTDPRRRRAFAFSNDGAHWDVPSFARDIVEINCQGSLIRFDDLLIATGPEPEEGTLRTNLVLRKSADYGKTWSDGTVLEPGIAGYSALARDAEGRLLCLYETWEDWRMMRQVLLTIENP